VKETPDKIFLRVPPELKKKWQAVCTSRKIVENTAGRTLVEWFVQQNDLVQLMVLGQLAPTEELMRLAVAGSRSGSSPRRSCTLPASSMP
jgi:hypothetical protein